MLSGHRCAVVGHPVDHSLSPVLHRAAWREIGFEGEYSAIDIRAGGLADFVAGLDRSWRGLSVTMPLKNEALRLGLPTKPALITGAANTVVLRDDGIRVSNTDAPGLADALRTAGMERIGSATILGGGATARSTIVGLADLGVEHVTAVVRTPARVAELEPVAEAVGVRLSARSWSGDDLPNTDLTVSTVVAGAADELAEAVAATSAVVFDIIYDPWPTAVVEHATAAGRTVLGGLDLLVGQAVLQVQAMTGQRVSADILLSAGRAELQRRAGA